MDNTELEKILKAIANKRRLHILKYLIRVHSAPVIDIADDIEMTTQTTSKHLGVLYAQGIVKRTQKSFYTYYSISPLRSKMVHYILNYY